MGASQTVVCPICLRETRSRSGMHAGCRRKRDLPMKMGRDYESTLKNIKDAERKASREKGCGAKVSPVLCVETGEVFRSCSAAGAALGIDRQSIARCVRGDAKTVHGYTFRRADA